MARGNSESIALLFDRRRRREAVIDVSPERLARQLDEERAGGLWREVREQLRSGKPLSQERRRDLEALFEYCRLAELRHGGMSRDEALAERIWLCRRAGEEPLALPADIGPDGRWLGEWMLSEALRGEREGAIAAHLEQAAAACMRGEEWPASTYDAEWVLKNQVDIAQISGSRAKRRKDLPPPMHRILRRAVAERLEPRAELAEVMFEALGVEAPKRAKQAPAELVGDSALFRALCADKPTPGMPFVWLRDGVDRAAREEIAAAAVAELFKGPGGNERGWGMIASRLRTLTYVSHDKIDAFEALGPRAHRAALRRALAAILEYEWEDLDPSSGRYHKGVHGSAAISSCLDYPLYEELCAAGRKKEGRG